MKTSTEIARLAVEDMSASEAEAFLKWLQKRVPAKAEAETPNMTSAALWWLAKLKSGNVLPGIGWPTMLPVARTVISEIAAMVAGAFASADSLKVPGEFLARS